MRSSATFRTQAEFAENVSLALILAVFVEAQGSSEVVLAAPLQTLMVVRPMLWWNEIDEGEYKRHLETYSVFRDHRCALWACRPWFLAGDATVDERICPSCNAQRLTRALKCV
jgi:hypothetical protein